MQGSRSSASFAGVVSGTPVSIDGGNPIADLDLALVDLYVPAAPEVLRWTGAATLDRALETAYGPGRRL